MRTFCRTCHHSTSQEHSLINCCVAWIHGVLNKGFLFLSRPTLYWNTLYSVGLLCTLHSVLCRFSRDLFLFQIICSFTLPSSVSSVQLSSFRIAFLSLDESEASARLSVFTAGCSRILPIRSDKEQRGKEW